MLDTIRFEIKDISQGVPCGYEFVNGKKRYLYTKGTNERVYDFLRSWGSGNVAYDVQKNRHIERELSVNLDADTYKEKFRIINRQASSNYKITILASVPNDSLICEFSIPKYFFGTNVFQYIDNPLQQKFGFGENVNMAHHFKKLRKYLETAIVRFCENEFPEIPVNFQQVFIRRVDVCYNAVFRTVQEKLDYLNMQKQIQKKYDRGTKNRHYKESIFINTKDYSFKIYDKGEEFKKSDFKKLKPFYEKAEMVGQDWEDSKKPVQVKNAKGKKMNKESFLLEEGKAKLQEFANRILRFEMTFRNSYFTYIYNNKIRGKDSEIYKTKKRIFYSKLKSIESAKKGNSELQRGNIKFLQHISDTIALELEEGQPVYSYLNDKYRLSHIKDEAKEDLNFWTTYYKAEYKVFTEELNKERNFSLVLNHRDKIQNKDNLTNPAIKTVNVNLRFGELLCGEICKIFYSNILQFIPKKYDSYSYMVKKLYEHNKYVEEHRDYLKNANLDYSGLSPNLYKGIFLALKSVTFKKYKQLIEMPDPTYHRIKGNLALLGITEDMVVADFDIDIDLTFESYYQELQTWHHLYTQFVDQTLDL